MTDSPTVATAGHDDGDVHRLRMREGWDFLTGLLMAGQVNGGPPAAVRAQVPLTILAGFLGAGKTTLLNHILADPGGRRILVLVNDFSQINIDEKLIESRSSDVLTLSNGCACCSLAGELAHKLVEVCKANPAPDVIVLEASGLSDPNGLAQVVLSNPLIRLDGIVTVVDATNMREYQTQLVTAELFRAQLSAADLVVLNKLDLVPDEDHETSMAWVAAIVGDRPVLGARRAAVPVDVILGIDRHIGLRPPAPVVHPPAFESWSLSRKGALDSNAVKAWLAELPASILRAKGVLWLHGTPCRRVIYQRVGKRWDFSDAETSDEAPFESIVMFVGPKGALDAVALDAAIDACQIGTFLR